MKISFLKLSFSVIISGIVLTGCNIASDTNFDKVKETIASTPKATLDQDVKNTLSYMGNEERLAHDLYINLYNYHIDNASSVQQLLSIGTKSETQHIEIVQLLVQKYIVSPDEFSNVDLPELNYKETDISDMQMGVYDISDIQSLYDTLYSKGVQSVQDALAVGCMVEVTDITDLSNDIALAENVNASDIVTAFEFLRDGSYRHYWSFDSSLKNIGVSDGCCSLGDTYCHPEYPNTTGSSSGRGRR